MFLIYPYWNINIFKDDLDLDYSNVSNLSILEYKFSFISELKSIIPVFLIYPYWNINVKIFLRILPPFLGF